MIEIPIKIKLSDVDKIQKKILEGNNLPFVLPSAVDSLSIALLPTIIELFAFWNKRHKSAPIIIPLDSNDSDFEILLERYLANYIPYACLLIGYSKDVTDRNGISIKVKVNNPLNIVIDAVKNSRPLVNKRELLLPCFDHFLTPGLLKQFYKGDVLIPKEDFYSEILRLLQLIANNNPQLISEALKKHSEDLCKIVYEAFKNTDDWAKSKGAARIRGVYLKYHEKKKQQLIEYSEGNEGLRKYFGSDLHDYTGNSILHFLEITVFDNGPGLFNTYMKNSLIDNEKINSELLVYKLCLIKNNSGGHRNNARGIGLDKILSSLDGKGFFMFRTGRMFLYRNLIDDRYIETEDPLDIVLYDWFNNSATDFTSFVNTDGAQFTFLFPLKFKI